MDSVIGEEGCVCVHKSEWGICTAHRVCMAKPVIWTFLVHLLLRSLGEIIRELCADNFYSQLIVCASCGKTHGHFRVRQQLFFNYSLRISLLMKWYISWHKARERVVSVTGCTWTVSAAGPKAAFQAEASLLSAQRRHYSSQPWRKSRYTHHVEPYVGRAGVQVVFGVCTLACIYSVQAACRMQAEVTIGRFFVFSYIFRCQGWSHTTFPRSHLSI